MGSTETVETGVLPVLSVHGLVLGGAMGSGGALAPIFVEWEAGGTGGEAGEFGPTSAESDAEPVAILVVEVA
jgi:hypothetical protein